jgi:hypothetical protein
MIQYYMIRGCAYHPLRTNTTSLPTVPCSPIRLYINIIAYKQAIPLLCFLALHLIDGRSDCPLDTDVALGLPICNYARLDSTYIRLAP